RNTIIIMTSNAGARDIGKNLVGFGRESLNLNAIDEEVKRSFTPEFRNRLDKIIVFNQITKEMALDITKKEISKFKEKLKEKNIEISISNKVLSYISNKGLSKEFGGREIKRVINAELKTLLIDEILFGKLSSGGKCSIGLKDNKLVIKY
ncbi:MAG: AAA family ATPase, partial [Clostridium sp.]|nr:AAA family ATPase [Clostridium sp.]